ncbi:MAG: M15 family metallopeptidase [Pseudomonadota bacterium]|nr:M15 family metallopeptidase [Pseudomonadota bacterium]
MNRAELTGKVRSHIIELAAPECALHVHAVAPFLNLRRAALADGFDLSPVSSFRDFSRQLSIWNGKFSGEKPLLDEFGRTLDADQLSPMERVDAILLWSALPGASRHHWGTDLDLIDRNAAAPGYRVQLTPEEFATSGPFAAMAEWLDVNAQRFGFFRPFRGVLSGVQPEPWHFSFAPLADEARRRLTPAVLREAIDAAPLLGKEQVLARLEELHARYVAAIDLP